MAWGAYEDQLAAEMQQIMSDPLWSQTTALSSRVGEIRELLAAAGLETENQATSTSQAATLEELLAQFQTAYDEGTAANEQRYSDLLSGYTGIANQSLGSTEPYSYGALMQGYSDRTSDLSSLLDQYGQAGKTDISNVYDQQAASAAQDLTSRGLGNTTIQTSVDQGLASAEAQDLARYNEDLSAQKVGLMSGWTGDALTAQQGYAAAAPGLLGQSLGVMERRTDLTPNLSDIANLAMLMGQGSSQTYGLSGFLPSTMYNATTYPTTPVY